MQADLGAIRRRLVDADDHELYRVAHAREHEFIPEVIALARELLQQRGLDADAMNAVSIAEARRDEELSSRHGERKERSEQLTFALCAITGIFITLIVTVVLMADGKRHLIRHAWKGCAIGWLVKLGLMIAATMLIGVVEASGMTPDAS